MYKIYCENEQTSVKWVEYGFSRYIVKRIAFLTNEDYMKVNFVFPLSKTFSNFIKCCKGEETIVE